MKRHELHVYSEEAMAALRFFLSHVVLPRKRERYLALIAQPQSRHKFLSTFHSHPIGALNSLGSRRNPFVFQSTMSITAVLHL